MLTEYALTPHLFDDEHNATDGEWLERLRAFGDRLLPVSQDRVFNAVISDLYDASWYASGFVPLVENLEKRQEADRTKRLPALDLLKALRPRIEQRLVVRPASGDYPSEEEEWATEAVASSEGSGLPMHRIVASSVFAPGGTLAGKVVRLRDTSVESFWDGVGVTQDPPANVGEQCKRITRMCWLYPFLALVSPQLHPRGQGKDLAFTIEMLRVALNRPRGFLPLARFDIHAEGPFREEEREPFAKDILKRIEDELGNRAKVVRLFLWPDVLERRLFVGRADGDRPAIVWVVSVTHVARPDTDGPDQDHATFAVLPPSAASKLASRYYSHVSRKPYAGSPFTVS